MEYQWAEKKPGEWWYAQIVDGKPWLGERDERGSTYYPPDMYVQFVSGTDGLPMNEDVCWHLYNLYNGKMPDDPSDDEMMHEDYWHLCGSKALTEFVSTLLNLQQVLDPR